MVGILVSFWDTLFSGAKWPLVSGRVNTRKYMYSFMVDCGPIASHVRDFGGVHPFLGLKHPFLGSAYLKKNQICVESYCKRIGELYI